MNSFADIVEDVKKLDFEEIKELNLITEKYLIELERDMLLESHKQSIIEYKSGKLKFSSDINELKEILDKA